MTPVFLDLMAHPRTLAIIRTMIGDWLHLDHAYGLQMDTLSVERGHTRPNLHGGPRTDQGEHQYQWFDGQMYNGLIVVMYNLEDVNPGDGRAHMRSGKPQGQPELQTGGGFTSRGESLVQGGGHAHLHGSPGARYHDLDFLESETSAVVQVFPGHSTWAQADILDDARELAANDLQRDLLRPPSVGKRSPVVFPEV